MNEALRTFGLAVRAARVAAGMTLAQLAEAAFDNPDRKGYVSQIENGKKQINPLNDAAPPDDTPTPADENAAKMIAAAETEGTGGVAEALLIALAYDYAEGDATDMQGAYKGLRAALETAREMAARADLPDNTDAAISAVRAKVQWLNEAGDPDGAAAVIDDALARQKAGMASTLELGIQQDRLRNKPEAAAEKVVQQVRLDVSEGEMFDALRELWIEWYVRGRDAGLNFELEVAIALARTSSSVAKGLEQRGTASNYLGVALGERGARESGTVRLEAAVAAHRAALEEFTQGNMRLEYAMTQMNLGNALRNLGEREIGTVRLEEAVAVYRAALRELSQDKEPQNWAMAQMNLGTVLHSLGERENGTTRLEEAVMAYRAALEEYTREKLPLDWAMVQMNLGNALASLGERESETARFEEAVAAYCAALEEQTRDKVPLDWAKAQMNLGAALQDIGERESGTERLVEAVAANRAALKEYTWDKVPWEWAKTQHNLCRVEISFFDKTGDSAHLDAAEGFGTAALNVFRDAQAGHYIEKTEDNLLRIQRRRDGLGK